jgi:hypothetical protein
MWEKTKRSLDESMPRLVTSNRDYQQRELMKSVLPKGCNLMPEGGNMGRRTGASFGASLPSGVSAMGGTSSQANSTAMHMMRPYDPEVEDPSRQFYPQDRLTANRYWRLFHKYDPVFGMAIDLFCEMVISDFELILEDDPTKSIKDSLEYMNQTVNIQDKLKHIIREYLVIGEAFPHNFFNTDTNLWDYVTMHNPDLIDVKDINLVNCDPIINFIPDQGLKAMLSDGSPESREFRKKLPAEFVSKVLAGQKIRLNPVNCSFIARKMHAYENRGTSLASRLFKVLMLEDGIFASSLATYRRAANPLKIAKLGDSASGWIPSPAVEAKLADLLARAETDPQCFVPETPVTMLNGSRKPIGDLVVGDKLLSKDGVETEVLALQEEETDKIIRISVWGDETIECTPNHKWPIWGNPRECSCGCGSPILKGNFLPYHGSKNGVKGNDKKYVEKCTNAPSKVKGVKLRFFEGFDPMQVVFADKIHKDDFLMIPRKFDEKVEPGVTLEMARLLGYYTAEGSMLKVYQRDDGSVRWGVHFSLHEKEKDTLAKDISEIIEKITGEPISIYLGDRHNCQVSSHRNSGSDLAVWLRAHAGEHSYSKKLSQEVMQWPLDFKREFIKGYLSGDGGVVHEQAKAIPHISVSSVSRDLICQVKLILAQLGGYASLYTKLQSEKSYGKTKRLIYKLNLYGNFAAELANHVWGVSWEVLKHFSGGWCDDNYVYVRVKKVEEVVCSTPRTVVNMTVSGDHNYLAGCFGTKNSWLIWNYGINFDAFGVAERSTTIGKELNTINELKFLGLGLSKGFVTSDATYASAKSGLQVFLRRLLSLRQFIESIWLYPKYFRPICEINEWVKAIPSEVTHRYRVKRTAQEIKDQKLLLLPKLQWKNRLDPSIDSEVLNALNLLKSSFGYKVSKSTLDSFTGLDWASETRKSVSEWKQEQETVDTLLGATLKEKYNEQNAPKPAASPPGAPGSGAKPPAAGGKPPGPGSGAGSFPPGSAGGGGEAAPGGGGASLNMQPESPASGGVKQTIE